MNPILGMFLFLLAVGVVILAVEFVLEYRNDSLRRRRKLGPRHIRRM